MQLSRKLLVLSLVISIVLNISLAVYWSATNSSFSLIFLASFTAWLSYSGSHVLLEGKWVDDTQNELKISNGKWGKLGGAIGIISMVIAFPVGVYGVNQLSFYLILSAETLFIGGYLTTHKSLTGLYL